MLLYIYFLLGIILSEVVTKPTSTGMLISNDNTV